MCIKKIGTLFAALAASLSAAPFSAITEEDADIYVSLRSLADTRRQWKAHPFRELLKDPKLQAFFEPWTQFEKRNDGQESMTEVLQNDFDLTWDEVFELFPGQVALTCHNVPELILEQAQDPELVVMAEYAGTAERLEELMQLQFERNAEKQQAIDPEIEHRLLETSFMGETLHFDEVFGGEETYIEDGYALVDGVFILATPEHRLRSAVETLKDGADSALSDKDAYLRAREAGGRGDFEIYFNLETILSPLNAALLDQLMQGGAVMLGLNAENLNKLFSLETLQAFFLNIDLIDTGLQTHSGLLYREKVGLLRLLTYADQALPEARFVPEGISATTITNFDLGEMLTELESLLASASPNLRAQLDTQMQMIQTNTGVDLRSAVLHNFTGEFVSLSILPEQRRGSLQTQDPDQVYVVELEDAEALSNAIEALKDMVPGMREQIRTQDFSGERIHSFKPVRPAANAQASPHTVSYVISRSHFMLSVGRMGLLQEVLSRLESGETGFWQKAQTEIAFEKVAETGAVARSYIDLEHLLLPILQSMAQASQRAGKDSASALDSARIPRALPLPYALISETNEVSGGIFNRSLILPRKDLEE